LGENTGAKIEDLNRANKLFKELFDKLIVKDKVTKEQEAILYLFYLKGFSDGSGSTQEILA
jgi:hypothetical protein